MAITLIRRTTYSRSGLGNADHGPDIRDWLKQPTGPGTEAHANGGWLKMPWRAEGYYGGDMGDIRGSAYVHGYDTNEPNDGWLGLMPEEPGAVFCDLSPTAGGASISDPTKGGALIAGGPGSATGEDALRSMCSGIKFEKGTLSFSGTHHMAFIHCDMGNYPYGQLDGSEAGSWKQQFDDACRQMGVTVVTAIPDTATYMQAGGSVQLSQYMKGNYQPTGLRLQQGFGNNYCSWFLVLGCNIAHCGDDGAYNDGTHHFYLVGTNIYDIHHRGYGADVGAGIAAHLHNDSIQLTGNEYDFNVLDSLVGMHWQIRASASGISLLTGKRLWMCHSDGAGMSLDASAGQDIDTTVLGDGTSTGYIRYFGMGINWDGTYSGSGATSAVVVGHSGPGNSYPTIPREFDLLDSTALAALGIHMTANEFDDFEGEVVGNAANPANLWQAANPADDPDSIIAPYLAAAA